MYFEMRWKEGGDEKIVPKFTCTYMCEVVEDRERERVCLSACNDGTLVCAPGRSIFGFKTLSLPLEN